MISFTQRELHRAWRNNFRASQGDQITNSQRLLLFYAVECGLKALILKNENNTLTEESPHIGEAGHDLKKLMRYLYIDGQFKLPDTLSLSDVRKKNSPDKSQRTASGKDLNQIWRYGGNCISIKDSELEKKLKSINDWIKDKLL
ncbi:MAG: hypothetical protein R6V54_12595 [Desulfobacteraceae bacterium]